MNTEKKEMKCEARKGKKHLLILVLIIGLSGFGVPYCSSDGDKGYHGKRGKEGYHGWHHGKRDPEKRAQWIIEKMTKKLNLTADQVTKVNKIKVDVLAKREEMRSLRKGILTEVIAQTKSDKVDQDKLNLLFVRKEAKFKELRAFMVSKYAELHAILTPEQRIKLVDYLEKRRDRWQKKK